MQILFLTAIATMIMLNCVDYKILMTDAVINGIIYQSMAIIFNRFKEKNSILKRNLKFSYFSKTLLNNFKQIFKKKNEIFYRTRPFL